MIMVTRRDLRNWVDTHVGDNVSQEDIDRITDIIARDPDSPDWGVDWSYYLDELPMLVELLEQS